MKWAFFIFASSFNKQTQAYSGTYLRYGAITRIADAPAFIKELINF